jgi:hypothetical protein
MNPGPVQSEDVNSALLALLDAHLSAAGIRVHMFALKELSYAPVSERFEHTLF